MKWQHKAVGHWSLKDGSYTVDMRLVGETWQVLVAFEGTSIFYTMYIDRADAMQQCINCIEYDRHARDPNRGLEE